MQIDRSDTPLFQSQQSSPTATTQYRVVSSISKIVVPLRPAPVKTSTSGFSRHELRRVGLQASAGFVPLPGHNSFTFPANGSLAVTPDR